MKINWEGDKEIMNAFNKAVQRSPELTRKAVYNTGEKIKKSARDKAPVDTGFLKSQIAHNPLGLSSEIVSQAGYSGFLEKGTRKMPAQPFMQPAMDDNKAGFEKLLKEILEGAFK